MAGPAVRARPSAHPGRVRRGARSARGAFSAGGGAGGAGRGERARCQGPARSTAAVPPARRRWQSGRHATRPADRLRASRAQSGTHPTLGSRRAGDIPGRRALDCRDSARSRTLAEREARDPPGGPVAGLPGATHQQRTGGTPGRAATARRDSARSRAGPAGGPWAAAQSGHGPRECGQHASTVQGRRAGGMPERARPGAGCSARSRAETDGREARQPPAGPTAGLPSGLSNLPHRERAEDQRRRAAHPGVPPARAPTASRPGSRLPAPGHQRCRSTGAARCRCAEVGSPYVCRERPPRLDRL